MIEAEENGLIKDFISINVVDYIEVNIGKYLGSLLMVSGVSS